MALISGALPPNTCYGTPQQLLDLFAQYLSLPGQNLILEAKKTSPGLTGTQPLQAGSSATFTVDVAGASLNDVVAVNPSTPIPECFVDGYVSSSNQVTVRVLATKTQVASLPARDYYVKVLKYSSN
ncbi:hypothetical protein EBX31_00825 [bacterium]|nr:hypothetical protein [bacterium]